MIESSATVRPSYRTLRGLNLGADFVRNAKLSPGQKYPLIIAGVDDTDLEGTLDKSGFIGGLASLYNAFKLKDGDKIKVAWDGTLLRFDPSKPPDATAAVEGDAAGAVSPSVFERKALKHLHIERFAPGNLSRWNPQTETDVYMTFGVLSEYTDFHYCCGASKTLLDKLGFKADTKPDAILIHRASNAYLMAEFKMRSSEFKINHKKDDIDVLVCWLNDEADGSLLPPHVLSLKSLLETIVQEGEIDL